MECSYALRRECSEVCKQGLDTGKSQQDSTQGLPSLFAVPDKVVTCKIGRKCLEDRVIEIYQVLFTVS